MPMCMCASTQPGNASKFFASNTCFDCSLLISGARRATLPSAIAMSRRSSEVWFGRTTRAFLITRSNSVSMCGFLAALRLCSPGFRSQAEIGALEIGIVGDVGGIAAEHDRAILQDIGATRQLESLHHILLDEQQCDAFGMNPPDHREHLLDEQR